MEENPHLTASACESGNVSANDSAPIMSLFHAPSDSASALERLHFEISRCLQTIKTSAEHKNPFQPQRHASCAVVPQGASKSRNHSWSQAIKTMIESNASTVMENNDNFANRVLSIMELKHNDELFNFTVKKDITGKVVMPWLHYVGMTFRMFQLNAVIYVEHCISATHVRPFSSFSRHVLLLFTATITALTFLGFPVMRVMMIGEVTVNINFTNRRKESRRFLQLSSFSWFDRECEHLRGFRVTWNQELVVLRHFTKQGRKSMDTILRAPTLQYFFSYGYKDAKRPETSCNVGAHVSYLKR